DVDPEEDVFYDTASPDRPIPARVYLVMSNQRGLQELVRLWETFQQNPEAPAFAYGRAKWGHLFRQLKELRPWGPTDRLMETGLLEEWQRRVQSEEQHLRIEIELWYLSSARRRALAQATVSDAVRASGGQVLSTAEIGEIAYHA